jgi:hypothetical protein
MSDEPVRAKLKVGIILVAGTASLTFVGGSLASGVAVLALAGQPGLIAGPIMIAVALLVAYFVSSTNLWVEVAGDTIRERRLFTGKVIEREVADVSKVVPLFSGVGGATEVVMDAMLGTTNRGYVIRFRSGGKIGLVRGDNSGVDEFMVALKSQLGDRWTEVTASTSTKKATS